MGFMVAKKIRIHPQTWHHGICLRAEIFGMVFFGMLTLFFEFAIYLNSLPMQLVNYLFLLSFVVFFCLWVHNIGQVQVIAGLCH